MSKHTPGFLESCALAIMAADGRWVANTSPTDNGEATPVARAQADTFRLVSCWNACEGIADPSVVPELLEALKFALQGVNELNARYRFVGAEEQILSSIKKRIWAAAAKAEGRES